MAVPPSKTSRTRGKLLSPRTPLKMRHASAIAGAAHETAARFYDFAPAIYMMIDATGLVIDVNQTGCRMLGATRHAIVGLPFRTFVSAHNRAGFLEHLRRCRAGEAIVESEITLRARDGGTFVARVYSRRLQTAGRTHFPTVAVDLTELRSLERAQQAAERERDQAERERACAEAAGSAKDRLIAMVSHELRNPLNPALIAADGLSTMPGLPEHAKHLALVIKRNVELEAKLISDLLDIARITRGQLDLQFATTDVQDVLLDALGSCAPAAQAMSVAVALDLRAASHFVHADGARLRQVFWNILNNAVKFSEPGGTVLVRTENVRDGDVETWKVTIRDRGLGMTPDVVQRLFTPFDRPGSVAGRRGGLGLGLAIAKTIVDGHGGQIAAASTGLNLGTAVDVILRTMVPPSESAATSADSRDVLPDESLPAAGRRRVLIVEDHADTGAMLSLFLSQHDCDVTLAQSLGEGLTQLTRPWDVVLSDIGLVDGSGLEIGRQASALDSRPRKLIALSGYGSLNDIGMSLHAGFDEHLVKPVDLRQLLELVQG